MNKLYKNIILAATTIALMGCTAGYDKVNTNPGGVTNDQEQQGNFALQAALVQMEGMITPINQDEYEMFDCLLGNTYGGYLSEAKSNNWANKFSTYNAPDSWISDPFNNGIGKIFAPYIKIKQVATQPTVLAVADIIKVMAISRVLAIYGPIPYSKIGSDGALTQPYDTEKEVYTMMFTELDNSIKTIAQYGSGGNFATAADPIYKGNAMAWGKLANSLRLRLAMRIVNVEPAMAQQQAELSISDPIGLLEVNTDNAFYDMGNVQNPIYVDLWIYQGSGGTTGNGDFAVSADLDSYMNGYADPRRAKYFTPSAYGANNYDGLRCGIDPIPSGTNNYSGVVVGANDPLMVMNASEIAFLRAEGVLRGWNMGGTAQSFYEQGIQLSFDQWGAGSAATYVGNNTSTPRQYADRIGSVLGSNHAYTGGTSTIKIKWDEAAGTEVNLERIITQKWIANFPLGIEAWTEYRRTGYPRLMPPVNNLSGGIINDLTTSRARRLPYPQGEYINNGDNVKAAVQMLGGADNYATKLWWDTK